MDRAEAIDILVGVIATNSEEGNEALDLAIEALKAPTLVLCKDCRYSRVYAVDSNEEPQRWCKDVYVKAVDDYDFCSWGHSWGERVEE